MNALQGPPVQLKQLEDKMKSQARDLAARKVNSPQEVTHSGPQDKLANPAAHVSALNDVDQLRLSDEVVEEAKSPAHMSQTDIDTGAVVRTMAALMDQRISTHMSQKVGEVQEARP